MTSLSRYVKHTPHAVDESLTKLSAIHKRIVAIDMDPDLMELYTRNASAIVQQGVRKEILLHKMNDAKKKSGQTSQCAEGKKSTFTSSLLTTSSSHSSPSLVGDSSLRSTKEDEEYFPFQIAARLQTVLLCQNWCKTINGIVQFCNVTRLSLRNNVIERIRDCEPLGLLPKLQCVALGGNPVARLPNFKCHLLRICSWPKPLSLHACRLREIDGVCVAEMDVKLAMGALHQESVYFPRIAERLHLYDLAVCGRNRFRMEEEWLRNVKQRMEGGISQSSSPSSSSSSAIPRAQRKFSDVFMYALKHHCIRPVDCHRETIDASKGKDYQAYMEDRVRVYILQHFSFSATVVPSRATMGTERKVERPQDKSSVPVADPTHPSRALSSTAPSVQQCAVYSDVLAAIEAEVLQIVYANAPGVSFSTPSKENQEAPPTKSPLWHTWHRVLEVERQWKEKEDEDRRIQEETARKSRLRRSSVKGGAKEESSIMSAESSSGSGGSSGNRSGTRNNTTTDDIRHSFCSSTSFSTTSFSAPSSFSHTKEISLEGGNGSTRRHRPTKGCSSSAAPFPSSTSFFANPFAPPADHSPVPPIFSSSSSSSIVAPPTPRTPDPDRASQTKHTFSSHVDTFAPHARRPRQAAPPSQVPLDTSVSWISTLSASERSAVSTASTGSRRVIQSPFHHRRPQVKKGIPPTPISSSTVVPPSPSIPSTTRTNAVAHEGESKSSSSSSSCTGSRVGSTMTTTSWVSEPTATLSERLHRPPSPSSQEALATSHPASSQMSLHAVRERTSSSAAVSPSMDVSEPSSLLSFADVTISSISLDGSLDARAGLTPRSRFLSSSSSFTTTPDNTIVHHENDNERARGGGGVRAAATEEDEKKTCAPGNDDPRYTRYHVESSGKGREYQRVRSVLHAIASLHPRELFPSPSPSPSRVVVPSRAVEENTEAPACDGMAGVSPWRERVVAHQERPVEAEKRVTHRTAARESDRETIGSSSSTPTGRWRERVVASENTTPTSPLARDTAAPVPYEKDDDDKVAQQWRRDRSQWGVFQKWRQQCFLRRRNGRVLPSAVGHDHPSVVHEWCPCVASSTAGAGRERTMAIACRQAKEEEEEVPPCNAPPLRAMLSPSALVVTAGESVAKKHRVSDELRKEKSSCCLLPSAHSRSLSYAAVCFVWWRQWATAAHHRRLSMLRRVWHRWCGERGTRWASPKEPTKASADLSTSPPPRRPTVRRVPPLSSSSSFSRSPPIASTVQEEADGNRRWQKATTARRRGKTRWDAHPYYVTMRGGESPAVHLPEKPKGLEECEEKKEHQKKCEMEERGRGKGGVRIPPTTAGLLLRTSTPSREDFSEDPFGVLSRVVHRLQSRPLSASLPFASSSPPRRDDAHDVVDALPLPTESTTTTAASPSAAPCIPADTSSPSLSVPIHLQSSPPPSILSFSSFSHPLDGTPLTHRTAPSSSFSSFSSLPLLPHEHPYQLASWSSFHCSAPHALTSLFRPSSRPSRPEGFFPVRQEIGSAFSLCVGEVPSGASWGTPTVSRAPCVVGHPARAPQVSPLCWTSSMPREGDTPATARSNRRMERTPLSTTFSHSSSHRTHAIDTANGRQSSKRETREAIGLSEARRKDDERMRSLSSLSSCKRAPTTRDVHDTRGVHGERHAPLLRTIETRKQSCDAKGSTRMGDTGKSSRTPPLCAGSEDASVVNGKGTHAQQERQESVRMSPKGSPLPSPKVPTDPSPLSFSSSSSSYASSLGAFSSSCRSSSIISSSSLFRIPTPLLSADGKRGCPTTTMDSRGGAEGGRHATKKEPSRSVGPAISPARLLPTSPVMPTPLARPLDTPPPRKPPLPHANTLLDVFPAVPSWDTGNETCRKAISRSFSFDTSFVEENPFPSTQSDACNPFTSSILSATLPESEPHSGKRSPTKIQDEKRIAFCRTLMEELRTRHAENERKRMQER